MHCSGHFKPILVYKGDRFKKGFRQSGNDRDEYVANNNGGFTIGHAPSQQLKPTSTYIAGYPRGFNSLGIDKTYRNNVKGHVVIYRQNGTGRDTYILGNNGGFAIQEGSKEFCGYQESFKRSLRKYPPPAETRQSKIVTSNSPVRHKSVAGSLATTLNRFKVYMKQRGNSCDMNAADVAQATKQEDAMQQKPKMGHYRTQSQTITKETTERIKEYLKQRDAFSRANALHKTLSQGSNGTNSNTGGKGRNGSHSHGRLFATQERSSSNPRSRNAKGQETLANEINEDAQNRTAGGEEASLIMAIKSSPSLNNAFNQRKQSNPFRQLQSQNQNDWNIEVSQRDIANFNTRNLNQTSTEDLGHANLDRSNLKERNRPNTTKFASRRLTHQPLTNENREATQIMFPGNEVDGIYQRHASPDRTPMQMFNEHQRLTCARLSVPHERRRRGRFNGTQNSFLFQTHSEANDQSPMERRPALDSDVDQTRTATVFEGTRKGNVSVKNSAFAPRVKSSLMGTSARQKLLKYKLAAQQTNDTISPNQKDAIAGTIAQIQKAPASDVFDHLKVAQESPKKDTKKSERQKQLESVYRTAKVSSRQNPAIRQTLAANLRKNSKVGSARLGVMPNAFGNRTKSLTAEPKLEESNGARSCLV